MSDRKDRSDRLSRRLDDEPDDDNDESSADAEDKTNDQPTDTPAPPTRGPDPSSVKSRKSVLMYLPADLRQELDARFDELNAQYKREHGEALEKNRDWYVAVIEAGLEGKDVEDILDI